MMRHSAAYRLMHALMGVLFVFNFAQPVWMSGMDMSSMNMSGMNMPGMESSAVAVSHAHDAHDVHADAAIPATDALLAAHCESMAGMPAGSATDAHHANVSHHGSDSQSSEPGSKSEECKQHECCASALVHSALSPVAALSWLPEHVISQQTPESVDCVVDTDVQLRLPFANGPPHAVIG